MSRFTKEVRQEIVREFSLRHNGQFNPALFLEEVRRRGPEHPAYEWFEWDAARAALNWQVEQARNFARDLKVRFTIEEVGADKTVKVTAAAMPLLLSPMDGRKTGGGYYLVDTDNPDHLGEHCHQAAIALRAWLNRYGSAVTAAGGSIESISGLIGALEAKVPPHKHAAE